MKKSNLKTLIKEEIYKILEAEAAPPTSDGKLQGQIKLDLFKKLGVADFDPTRFQTTLNLVRQNQSLNNAANKVLADIMVAMIKTSDDTLLNQIFQNLKQIQAEPKS